MANNVKTAISIHKELFEKADKLAEDLHVSRSKLFVMAVEDFIKKNENKNLLYRINQAFDDLPESDEIEIQNKMRKKQKEKLGKEPW